MVFAFARPRRAPLSRRGAPLLAASLLLLTSACSIFGLGGPGSFEMHVHDGGLVDLQACTLILAKSDIFEGTHEGSKAATLIHRREEFDSYYALVREADEGPPSLWKVSYRSNPQKEIDIQPASDRFAFDVSIDRRLLERYEGRSLGLLIQVGSNFRAIALSPQDLTERDSATIDLKKHWQKNTEGTGS